MCTLWRCTYKQAGSLSRRLCVYLVQRIGLWWVGIACRKEIEGREQGAALKHALQVGHLPAIITKCHLNVLLHSRRSTISLCATRTHLLTRYVSSSLAFRFYYVVNTKNDDI